MRDLYDTRLDHPPIKRVTIGVCPECGDESLSEVWMGRMYRDIEAWDNNSPDDYGDEEFYEMGRDVFLYYCRNCGHEFNTPDWREVESEE